MFAILKYIVSLFLMNLLKIAWILPVKKNDILFISFDGKQYSDNPKYISEYINSHEKNKNIIWAFILPQNYSYLYKNGYQIVSIHSIYFIFAILRAGTIITNCGIATYIPIRKNQTLLNTWHGGSPLKTVGLAEANHNQ